MTYNVIQIEGIGEVYAQKLIEIGIKTTDELLQAAIKPADRTKLAAKAGISRKLILRWANHADLMRITGVAGQFSELLEAAGVDTIKELRHRIPANLHAKVIEINEKKNLCNRVPGLPEIERMVAQAKEMTPTIQY